MVKEGKGRYGDLSYMLGGRSSHANPDEASPDGTIESGNPMSQLSGRLSSLR